MICPGKDAHKFATGLHFAPMIAISHVAAYILACARNTISITMAERKHKLKFSETELHVLTNEVLHLIAKSVSGFSPYFRTQIGS